MSSNAEPPLTIIEAGHGDARYWGNCWRFRELLYFLCWRDLLVRYKQTFFGILWGVIRPLLTIIIFSFVFGKIARLPSEGDIPYPLLVLAGFLAWQLFASGVSESSNSLIGNESLITKVFFPRMFLPATPVLTALGDYCISLILCLGLMMFYGIWPTLHILLLPFFVGLCLVLTFGIGLFIAAMNVTFRDFRYIIPFMLQIGLYVSPVGYASSVVPENWQLLFALNPLVGIIGGMRWCLLGGQTALNVPALALSCLVTGGLLALGIRVFKGMERGFADRI